MKEWPLASIKDIEAQKDSCRVVSKLLSMTFDINFGWLMIGDFSIGGTLYLAVCNDKYNFIGFVLRGHGGLTTAHV